MRMFGVVAILLAVAVLLMSVTKAEGLRHDEVGCVCCSLDAEVVGTSTLSFAAAQELAVELATVNDYETNRDAENLGREILASTAPRHEAGLRYIAIAPSNHSDREIRSGRYSGAEANVVLR